MPTSVQVWYAHRGGAKSSSAGRSLPDPISTADADEVVAEVPTPFPEFDGSGAMIYAGLLVPCIITATGQLRALPKDRWPEGWDERFNNLRKDGRSIAGEVSRLVVRDHIELDKAEIANLPPGFIIPCLRLASGNHVPIRSAIWPGFYEGRMPPRGLKRATNPHRVKESLEKLKRDIRGGLPSPQKSKSKAVPQSSGVRGKTRAAGRKVVSDDKGAILGRSRGKVVECDVWGDGYTMSLVNGGGVHSVDPSRFPRMKPHSRVKCRVSRSGVVTPLSGQGVSDQVFARGVDRDIDDRKRQNELDLRVPRLKRPVLRRGRKFPDHPPDLSPVARS